MKVFDLLNEALPTEMIPTQYIVIDRSFPDRRYIADTKKDVVDAIVANAIKKWQVIEADDEEIIADSDHDTILHGTITPIDKTNDRIKELMFDMDDDVPDHAPFPKVKADMEVVDPEYEDEI